MKVVILQLAISDWRQLMPTAWANVALALVSMFCGMAIGMEREKKEKPAGILTLTLVTLGAATFTMVSYAFVGEKGTPSRIVGQIVSGIGFLGAGVILRGTGGVRGTVTAATIWACAAIGMVAGSGYAGAAAGLSLLVLSVLTIVSRIDRALIEGQRSTNVRIIFAPDGGKTLLKIEDVLDVNEVHFTPKPRPVHEGLLEVRLKYCHAHRNHREFLSQIARLSEVKEIHRDENYETE